MTEAFLARARRLLLGGEGDVDLGPDAGVVERARPHPLRGRGGHPREADDSLSQTAVTLLTLFNPYRFSF